MIAVLDYGIGNLRSAEKALQRQGADARLVTDAGEALAADGVVLPGVGAFGRCMEALRASGLDAVAVAAVERGTPFLGICIGMQLLYESSEESPGVAGLGLLPGVVRRLPEGVKHPQMQWNRLQLVDAACPLLAGPLLAGRPLAGPLLAGPLLAGPAPAVAVPDPWVYFVHSYAPPVGPETVAVCDYGGPVAAMVGRDRLWATQFHPEKSGAVGLALLANFAAVVAGAKSGGAVTPTAG